MTATQVGFLITAMCLFLLWAFSFLDAVRIKELQDRVKALEQRL